MSLIIQPSMPVASPSRQGTLSAGPAGAAPAGVAAGGGDTAAFSPAAVLLALLQADPAGTVLPAPGSAQATALTTLLAQRMGALLREAGLPIGAALAFEVDGDDRVRVASSRPEIAQLQALVNAHPDVLVLVRLLHAINAAPLASPTAATLSASEPRTPRGDTIDPAAAPGPPLFHPWGWLGMAPGPRTAHAPGLRNGLGWRVAAVLIFFGLLLWLW